MWHLLVTTLARISLVGEVEENIFYSKTLYAKGFPKKGFSLKSKVNPGFIKEIKSIFLTFNLKNNVALPF